MMIELSRNGVDTVQMSELCWLNTLSLAREFGWRGRAYITTDGSRDNGQDVDLTDFYSRTVDAVDAEAISAALQKAVQSPELSDHFPGYVHQDLDLLEEYRDYLKSVSVFCAGGGFTVSY